MAGADENRRSTLAAILRGALGRCPRCERGRLLHSYLKIVDYCSVCGEPYGHFRIDDAAPWLTILIVGHITVPLILICESNFQPPLALAFAMYLPPDRRANDFPLAAMQGCPCGSVMGDEGGGVGEDLTAPAVGGSSGTAKQFTVFSRCILGA